MIFLAQQTVANGPVLRAILEMTDFILDYAITLAALGALTVAVIEAWKKLRDSQAKFHRASVLRWLQNEGVGHTATNATAAEGAPATPAGDTPKTHYLAEPLPPLRGLDGGGYDAARCFEQLLLLTTGVGSIAAGKTGRYASSVKMDSAMMGSGSYQRSIEFALFELELDRLMGQVQDAADVALNNPRLYPDLFRFLTRGADPDDVEKWVDDVDRPMTSALVEDEARKKIADRYTRLKQQIRRHLDSFQVVTAMRWREWNQLASAVVGAGLLFVAQIMALDWTLGSWPWIQIIPVSLLGGMLAPVAKDLVDALRKVKASV
jgi:hypothetical protein